MTQRKASAAMTQFTAHALTHHLRRSDGQEDLCFALYTPSTGRVRDTALIGELILPQPGERRVHGIVTFTGEYVLRAAYLAACKGCGIALFHSHPSGHGWQSLSAPDYDAESAYAQLVYQMTGYRLLGMTYAGGTDSWSARFGPQRMSSPSHVSLFVWSVLIWPCLGTISYSANLRSARSIFGQWRVGGQRHKQTSLDCEC